MFISVISEPLPFVIVALSLALKIMQTELTQLTSAWSLMYANAYLDLPFYFENFRGHPAASYVFLPLPSV